MILSWNWHHHLLSLTVAIPGKGLILLLTMECNVAGCYRVWACGLDASKDWQIIKEIHERIEVEMLESISTSYTCTNWEWLATTHRQIAELKTMASPLFRVWSAASRILPCTVQVHIFAWAVFLESHMGYLSWKMDQTTSAYKNHLHLHSVRPIYSHIKTLSHRNSSDSSSLSKLLSLSTLQPLWTGWYNGHSSTRSNGR